MTKKGRETRPAKDFWENSNDPEYLKGHPCSGVNRFVSVSICSWQRFTSASTESDPVAIVFLLFFSTYVAVAAAATAPTTPIMTTALRIDPDISELPPKRSQYFRMQNPYHYTHQGSEKLAMTLTLNDVFPPP